MTVVHPGAQLADFHRDLAPWPGGLRIAYAGLMLPFKGPQVLLHALAILHQRRVDFRCDLAGDTTAPQFIRQIQQFLVENDLSERVNLLGFQGRRGLARLFERSNVFVFPSLVPEAFGISQVEAMSAGLAVVTTATGGAREVVDSDCALLVEPNNPVQLADRLQDLYDDPASCERLGRNARERSSAFSIEASVDRIEAAAKELLARTSKRWTTA
jgi:glycosyltransferase involved in cell wall biosynthesis